MSLQDPIADMLTRIRNGQMVDKVNVSMPSSTKKVAIANVLQDEGYIDSYAVEEQDGKRVLVIQLKYFNGKPLIEMIKRESRPGLRVYKSADDIPKVNGGLGVLVMSTNKGVMSDRKARKIGVGGEIICSVF